MKTRKKLKTSWFEDKEIDSRKGAKNAETGLKKNILAIFAAWREQIQRSHPAIVNDDDFFRVDKLGRAKVVEMELNVDGPGISFPLSWSTP